MDTSWGSFLGVLPPWMREQVDALGAGSLRQLRLRLGKRPALELLDRVWRLDRPVADKDLEYCVNTASGYSPGPLLRPGRVPHHRRRSPHGGVR